MTDAVTPRSFSDAAAVLARAAEQGRPVRVSGGATKLGWGGSVPADALRLRTEHLSRMVTDDQSEMRATLGAGTPLASAQAQLARTGRMLAIDPNLGLGRPAATLGGVLATGDCGPLSHRYGPPVDQILAVTVALSDGSVVRTGLAADEHPHEYDLRRLMIGSFGTLGVLLAVDVRLQPLPTETATALGSSTDPRVLRQAVITLSREPHVAEAFDIAWHDGRGGLLVQIAGPGAEAGATAVANSMVGAGLGRTAVHVNDAPLWARQRAGQRSVDRAVVRVCARRSQLDAVLRLAQEADATLVGRAARGVSYMTMNVNQIASVRAGLPVGAHAVVLDLPQAARGAVDAWGVAEGPELELMRQVKRRFDPAAVCNPGIFVGRI